MAGKFIADEKAIWQVVVNYAHATPLAKLAPHDLRRTCAKLCRKAGGELEQIQLHSGTHRFRPQKDIWERSRT